MSVPRRIRRGATWFVTRRCVFRCCLLRPDRELNAIVGYCLAYAASRTGVQIHSFCILSNHIHIVLTDPWGEMPRFMRIFSGLTARAVNCHRGRWDHFWEGDTYSAVELLTPEAVLKEMVYTITNPVSSGLVRTHRKWPGLVSRPRDVGRWIDMPKPRKFFRKNGLAKRFALRTTVPPSFAAEGEAGFAKRLEQAVLQKETELQDLARQKGKTFLGRRAVLRQSPYESPVTKAPRRKLNPRLATCDGRLMREAKQELLAFYAAYREALKRFRAGVREAVFPEGTYLMRVHYGAFCAGPSG